MKVVRENLNESLKENKDMKPYSRANRWLIKNHQPDETGHVPGLYFWGSKDDKWRKSEHGEYKIDSFRCTDPWLALRLVAENYARIESIKDDGDKVIMLLMKREY